ncbi:MAG TPA: tetratricopeptide repeat protein [Thermoanaerobaculia bacterium]|nr:tetratricopeptide repeat protein [Thermoanaerobaculia bacterium]
MSERDQAALGQCEVGLQHMWKGEVDEALAAYDLAFALATAEDTRELITIRKAEALIAVERDGPEVAALAAIVMRRRSSRHVYLAANALVPRFTNADDRRRAIFYGEIAKSAVEELGDPFAHAALLNNVGVVLVEDSQFDRAIELLAEALAVLETLPESHPYADSLRCNATLNLGGAKILADAYDEGIELIESVILEVEDATWRADGLLDLGLGYLNIGDIDTAEELVREALALASTRRQIRNGNHLLGEICMRTERWEEADIHFDVVAGFYPGFKNLKQLLTAVDVCKIVNWKL